MLSEANFLCARENGSFVEVFPLLKHIKNLYLSSFLTQRVTFQVFQTSSLQHFHKTDYYRLKNREGQSWFGKWLELPWYWCVRVELSLQQGEKHGKHNGNDYPNIAQETSLIVFWTWNDKKYFLRSLPFWIFKCAFFISWQLLFWIATFSQCECNESVSEI